ncbi:MAG TPA: AI-2E family transporter [Bryobacteraceae bacterium]|nr:AI-2E family transporter [Bryobacteraceae bacterium]
MLVYTGLAVLGFLLVWFQLNLLLLAFAGILVAVLLEAITSWVNHHTRLNGIIAYLATLLLIAVVLAGICYLLVPSATRQIAQLVNTLPGSIERVKEPLQKTGLGREAIQRIRAIVSESGSSVQVTKIAGAVTNVVTDLVVVLVVGFFAALNPRGYKEGMLTLVPERRRDRTRRLVDDLQHQLKWWMLGQTIPMVTIGAASGIALMLLRVPLPWTLGVITAAAVFLPYAGTILAGILSVLIALQRGPQTALWVLIVYTLLHLAEGYLLTPLVQRRAVRLPPVLTILAQYFMWSVAGILGLALAAPLAGAGILLVKELLLHVAPDEDVVPEVGGSPKAA